MLLTLTKTCLYVWTIYAVFAGFVGFSAKRDDAKVDGVKAGPLIISNKAYNLIVEYECGSKGEFISQLSRPTWPGGASGVTIGIGYDLGYNTREQIAADWKCLGPNNVATLQTVAGLTGQRARVALSKVRTVVVSWEQALAVFNGRTLARFGSLTGATFPPIKSQHPHGQGALTSLVFNRGSSLSGESRREMLAIRTHLTKGNPSRVPGEIRAMRRLWVGKGLDGLLRRREAEATLFASGLARP